MAVRVRFVAVVVLTVVATATALGFALSSHRLDALAYRLPQGVRDALGISPLPRRNTCPICLQTSTFIPAGFPVRRPFAGCPNCRSLERHRMLYLYLQQKTSFFRDQLSVLHFSPEPGLSAAFAAQKNLKYATSWYEPDRQADFHLDLTKLALPDDSWDVIIAYHILEHIDDDRTAMREIHRVLKPGGWAVLQVPLREEPDTLEDASVIDDKGRNEKYGNPRHVRLYGWKDFGDRLTQAGFQVTIERFGHEIGDAAVREFALDRDERIYLVKKPLR